MREMETGVPPDTNDAFLSKSHELTVGIVYRMMQSVEGPRIIYTPVSHTARLSGGTLPLKVVRYRHLVQFQMWG